MGGVSSRPVVRFDPEPKAWPPLTSRARTHEHARETREALGLEVDRPVIFSGHQPTLWHPGILAKRYALHAATRAEHPQHRSQGVWLVVDQDSLDPWVMDVPIHRSDGSLGVAQIRLGPKPAEGVPMRAVPTTTPELVLSAEAAASVRIGLERAAEMLAGHRDAPSAAVQIERATSTLLGDGARAIYASQLHSLPVFKRLVEWMLDDPAACAQAYNRAVQAHGGARELFRRPDGDWELPLWHLAKTRRPVFASTLADLDPSEVAPKALSMTAMLRLEACDLFIHGSGGGATGSEGGYDRAGEAWIRDWIGDELCPACVVSADLHLDLLEEPAPDLTDLQRTVHRAHSALHDPALVGDDRRGHAKRALVDRIAQTQDPWDRSRLFREMHALLDEHREANREAIEQIAQRVRSIRHRLGDAQIAARRDWSFVLYPQATLDSLRRAIEECWS